jgi:outer membrane protein assembly factor BamA
MSYLIKDKPNRALIRVPFATTKKRSSLDIIKARLWMYNQGNKEIENRWNWFLKNKLGEPAVLLDTFNCDNTALSMQNYLFNKGYFDSKVSYEVYTYNKKAVVTYQAQLNSRNTIDTIIYPEVNSAVTAILKQTQQNSLLKNDAYYDAEILKNERERITTIFKNSGYLKFIKDLIYFDADSTKKPGTVELHIRLQEPKDASLLSPFTIENVHVITQFNFKMAEDSTLVFDTTLYKGIKYIYVAKNFRPEALNEKIFIQTHSMYRQNDVELTIRRLSELPIVKNVDVKYAEIKDTIHRKVDCFIFLKNQKKKEYTFETEAIANDFNNNSNNIGSNVNIGFKHKNVFKGGEVISLKQRAGVEWQLFDKQRNLSVFELNTQLVYSVPKFALPFKVKSKSVNNPKTSISIRNNYQYRYDNFKLNTSNVSFSYNWNENKYKVHTVTPLSINFFQLLETTPTFDQRLETYPALRQSFQEQFIVGGAWKYTYDKGLIGSRNPIYFTSLIDIAGNTLSLAARALKFNKNENDQYEIFKRPFSQFVRGEFDVRKYFNFSRRSSFIMRLAGGVGVPFGNSKTVLPFIKQFYIGGNNSLRAFPIRRLGPGSYVSQQTSNNTGKYIYIDQNGDLKIEANAELRFDIFKWFKGALFADAGNIWLLNKDIAKVGAEFQFNRFYNEIAVGTGAGIRLDFSYFIMRFDLGVPLRKPNLPENDRWLFDKISMQSKDWRRDNLILNLAIGFPF